MTTRQSQSDRPGENPPAKSDHPRKHPSASINKAAHKQRDLKEPSPVETEDGGEQVLSGQSREEGGERDI